MQTILFEKSMEGIGILTMHRPHVRNALNWEAMQAFADALVMVEAQDDLRALIVQGSKSAFCSGGDLSELHHYLSRLDGARLTAIMGDALMKLDELNFPTIAAIEGPAIGGGAEIALACDLRVMASDAVLGLMHVRLAIIPAWGGGQRLMRLAGYSRALEWLSTGTILHSEQALANGLADRVTPPGDALQKARELANAMARHDPAAVAAVKHVLRQGKRLDHLQALQAEREAFPDLWAAQPHVEASERFVSRKNHKPAQESSS